MPDHVAKYKKELAPPSQRWIDETWVCRPPNGSRPLTLFGPCFTCGHNSSQELLDEVVVGGTFESAGGVAPVNERTALVTCNCEGLVHEQTVGQPAGCGRSWLASVTRMSDDSFHIGVDTDYEQRLPIAVALQEAQVSEGKRVQGAAEKWLGAITAIYALFALAGIATAKDALIGVSTVWKSVVAVALLGGVVTAAGAVISGYTAAYGWLHIADTSNIENQAAWYGKQQAQAKKAANRLQLAILLTLSSVTFIVVTAMLVWFVPRFGVTVPTQAP